MTNYNQIRKLNDKDENLRIFLNKVDNDIHLLETENKNLKWQVFSLQMQLQKYQNKVTENETLLKTKDEKIAEYLEEINKLDHGVNSGQACPTCFIDMKQAIAKGSCWVQFEPCGHRTCYECFSSLPKIITDGPGEGAIILARGKPFRPRRIRCGICGALGDPLNGLLDNGTFLLQHYVNRCPWTSS